MQIKLYISCLLGGWAKSLLLPDSLLAFESVSTEYLDLFKVDVERIRHKATKSECIFLIPRTPTPEKTFAVSFRTPVNDSKGVPHIIEHATLSGSRLYPVREPIFYLGRSTTATFLNAMTYADKTVYPFSTLNPQDLLNIASVYLDAVFDPLFLNSSDTFEREGWHVELEDTDARLIFGGVVYNEMKGVYSNPDSFFWRRLGTYLLPNTTFQHDQGGSPFAIPQLSYSEFLSYYYAHYHPSNAQFFYYGTNETVPELLEMIDSYAGLSTSRERKVYGRQRSPEEVRSATVLYPQAPLENPIYVDELVPADPDHAEDSLAFAMRLADSSIDSCTLDGLYFLSSLLLDSPETPMWQLLQQSKIGKSISAVGVVEESTEILFVVMIKGVHQKLTPQDINENTAETDLKHYFDNMIMSFLNQRSEEGFNLRTISSKLNRMDFTLREAAAKAEKRGLNFMHSIIEQWNLDRDPLSRLRLEEDLRCLRSRVGEDDAYLKALLKSFFIDNPHRLVMRMVGDINLDDRRNDSELRVLDIVKDNLKIDELEKLVERTKRVKLIRAQPDSPENVAKLPRLPLDVVSREVIHTDYAVTLHNGVPIVTEDLPTANIAYVTFAFDLADLTLSELQMLQIADYIFFHGDSALRNAEEKMAAFTALTGGVRTDLRIGSDNFDSRKVNDPSSSSIMTTVFIKCLYERLDNCMDVLTEEMLGTAFQKNQNFLILHLKDLQSQLNHSLLSSPASVGKMQYQARLSLSGFMAETLSGLSSLPFLTQLLERAETDWLNLAQDLEAVWEKALIRENLAVNIALNEPSLSSAVKMLGSQIDKFPSRPSVDHGFTIQGLNKRPQAWKQDADFYPPNEDVTILFTIPSMVNYNLYGGHLSGPGAVVRHEDVIPATLLSEEYVLPHLRLVGGAYGASFSVGATSGTFTFSTYRDPNARSTFDTFLEAPAALQKIAAEIDQDTIDQAIIAAVSRLDAPKTNPQKARNAFMDWMFRFSKEDEEAQKQSLFSVTPATFKDFAARLQRAMITSPKIGVSVGKATVADLPGDRIIVGHEEEVVAAPATE